MDDLVDPTEELFAIDLQIDIRKTISSLGSFLFAPQLLKI